MTPVDCKPVSGPDDLKRLSDCMLGKQMPANLAHEAVLGMEFGLLCQGWPVGLALGAMPEVRESMGLGRPAFREAITILEARGMLDVRRGPGGGLFVAAPALEDVAGAVLMFLALSGKTNEQVQEFRLIVWRMLFTAAKHRHMALPALHDTSDATALIVGVAEHIGNTTMLLLTRLAELLTRISADSSPKTLDAELAAAFHVGDPDQILACLDRLATSRNSDFRVISLEVAERAFSLSGRKSAMALAARMTRELSESSISQEAEWETAERLGYTDAVVRQARRILQDFGIVQCRQGRKGAEFGAPATPAGVIRLLAPCMLASEISSVDTTEAISLLLSGAPVLAAGRSMTDDRIAEIHNFPSAEHEMFEVVMMDNMLLELSGNALLAIVVRALGVANIHTASHSAPPFGLRDVIAINRRILKAIERGDIVAASELASAKLAVMQRAARTFRKVA